MQIRRLTIASPAKSTAIGLHVVEVVPVFKLTSKTPNVKAIKPKRCNLHPCFDNVIHEPADGAPGFTFGQTDLLR